MVKFRSNWQLIFGQVFILNLHHSGSASVNNAVKHRLFLSSPAYSLTDWLTLFQSALCKTSVAWKRHTLISDLVFLSSLRFVVCACACARAHVRPALEAPVWFWLSEEERRRTWWSGEWSEAHVIYEKILSKQSITRSKAKSPLIPSPPFTLLSFPLPPSSTLRFAIVLSVLPVIRKKKTKKTHVLCWLQSKTACSNSVFCFKFYLFCSFVTPFGEIWAATPWIYRKSWRTI